MRNRNEGRSVIWAIILLFLMTCIALAAGGYVSNVQATPAKVWTSPYGI